LKSELTKSEARLDELSTSLGDRHPQRLQAAAQIARLREQLAAEMRRVSGGMATAGRVNAEKEQELRALFEAQKQRVLQLRSNRAELTVLTKDVENAQRAYETIVQRISQSGLESQSQQTNLHVLSAAVQPLSPSRPRIFLNLLAAVAGGMLLACLAALGMESLDRRIRSWRELAQVPDVPVAARVLHRPLDVDAANRVGPVAHDDVNAVLRAGAHAVGHRVDVGVDARADVLQVDDQRVQAPQHLGRRFPRVAVQRVDGDALRWVVGVRCLDHIVLHVRPESMLRAEDGRQVDTVARHQLVHNVNQAMSHRGVVADHADARAVEARRSDECFGTKGDGVRARSRHLAIMGHGRRDDRSQAK